MGTRIVTGLVCLAAWCCAAATAQCANPWQSIAVPSDVPGAQVAALWDPDGPGPAAAVLVVAGTFLQAGATPAANIAMRDLTTGVWSPLGAGTDGTIHSLLATPNGDLFAAGRFHTAGGVPAPKVARWNGATWSPCGAGPTAASGANGFATSLAVAPNGDVLVVTGSQFPFGQAVELWNGANWSSLPTPPGPGYARVVTVLPNGNVVLGTSGGQPTTPAQVLQWNGFTWTGMSSATAPPGSLVPASITALAAGAAGNLAVGVSGSGASVRLWNGTSWSVPAGAPTGSPAVFRELPNGDWLVGGYFPATLNPTEGPVYVCNSATSVLGPGLTGGAADLVVQGNGGVHALIGGTTGIRLMHWNGVSWSTTSADTSLDRTVNAIAALPNGEFVVGGEFTLAGGQPIGRIARRTAAGWAALGSGFGAWNASVRALAVSASGDVYAAGLLQVTGHEAVARWDGTAWHPLGAGLGTNNVAPRALAVLPNGDLVVGGSFVNGAGVGADHVARWNGSTWAPLGTGIAGSPFAVPVRAITALPNGDVVVTGAFSAAGGVAAANIARWDGSAWHALGSGLGGTGSALAVARNGDLIVGGQFATAGGVAVQNVARWDGSSWHAIGGGLTGTGPAAPAHAAALLVLPDGDLLAGGDFHFAGGVAARCLARWNGTAWTPIAASITAPAGVPEVAALAALANGDVVASGNFTTIDGLTSTWLARWTTTCPATATAAGNGCSGSAGPLVLTASSLPWTGATFRAQATGLPTPTLALLVLGWQGAAIPLASLLPQALPGCSLLATPDFVAALVATSGALTTALDVPDTMALAGIAVHEQVVALEFDLAGALLTVTSTNALVATIGTL